ncbi:MAG: winged helix-turn-helix domain-containing protein [Pyrinomonadaceae bacterium]|nr:winged helix-turn-helix domain-containing protein [Pyrinomonadaceae bacterium]
MKEPNECLFDFEKFRLDPFKRQLLREGKVVPLTSKALTTLSILVDRRGEVVTKDELMNILWTDTTVEENNLTQQISTLRKTLGEKKDEPKFIVTIPGQGYSFIAPVKRSFYSETGLVLEEITQSSITIDICDDDEKVQPYQIAGQNQAFWAIRVHQIFGGLIVAAYLFVFWSIYHTSFFPNRTFAVLPFKSIGKINDDDNLSAGITETLTAKIGNLKSLTVRPVGSASEYLGQEQNPIEAGRKLNVNTVLAGSIQRDGERVRITVQVLDVVKNQVLWGQSFNKDAVDSFTLQDMVSEEVARALQNKFPV